MATNDYESLTSIDKTARIFKQLCREPHEYKITELARLTSINRTSLHRVLRTLEGHGLVLKTEKNKTYKLGPMAYEMGSVYLNSFQFGDNIFPILDKISHESQESVGIAIREGEKVISLYEIEVDQPLKMNYRPGLVYPMNRGCYGKCLMAYYDQDRVSKMLDEMTFEKVCINTLTEKEEILKEYQQIRKQGYVISDEETFRYAVGVGVPIPSPDGSVRSCVAISFLKNDDYKKKIEEFKEMLFKYKDEITRYMV